MIKAPLSHGQSLFGEAPVKKQNAKMSGFTLLSSREKENSGLMKGFSSWGSCCNRSWACEHQNPHLHCQLPARTPVFCSKLVGLHLRLSALRITTHHPPAKIWEHQAACTEQSWFSAVLQPGFSWLQLSLEQIWVGLKCPVLLTWHTTWNSSRPTSPAGNETLQLVTSHIPQGLP